MKGRSVRRVGHELERSFCTADVNMNPQALRSPFRLSRFKLTLLTSACCDAVRMKTVNLSEALDPGEAPSVALFSQVQLPATSFGSTVAQ